jgi:polysaccharide export outer membrane protein
MKTRMIGLLLAGYGVSVGASPLLTEMNRAYRLAPGDQVEIRVYGEPDLSMKFKIDTSGYVNYPYLGPLLLHDRTTMAVMEAITQGLKEQVLLEPMVTVNIVAFRSVFVAGEVAQPGGYEYQPGLTVEKIIALAGGFTDRAARRDISLRFNGSQQRLEQVSLQQQLNPGDIITIEQSFF